MNTVCHKGRFQGMGAAFVLVLFILLIIIVGVII